MKVTSLCSALTLAVLGHVVSALPTASSSSALLPTKTIFKFSDDSFYDIENVAVRANGNLILNLLSKPEVYTLDPLEPSPTASLVYTFPNSTKVDGIAEYRPDVFAVIVGDAVNSTRSFYKIWSLDFTKEPVEVKVLASIPDALGLNGMTTLTGSYSETLLAGDAKLGAIWAVDVESGASHIALSDTAFDPSTTTAFGVNGIHVYDHKLYYTSSADNTFGVVPISSNGTLLGDELAIIATQLPGNVDYDDFAIQNGYAYICDHDYNIARVDIATGEQVIVVEGLTGPTAAAWARVAGIETSKLYVVTEGVDYDNGTYISGEVVEVYT